MINIFQKSPRGKQSFLHFYDAYRFAFNCSMKNMHFINSKQSILVSLITATVN